MSDDDGEEDLGERKATLPRAGTLLIDPTEAPPKKQTSPRKKAKGSGGTVMMEPTAAPRRTRDGTVMIDPTARASSPERPRRRSSGGNRTTLDEVGEIAQRLSRISAIRVGEPNVTRQLALSFAVSVTLVFFVTMIFAGGAWRLVLGILAGTAASTLAVWSTLRNLPKVATWLGPRELPGPPLAWVGGVVAIAAGVTVAMTWSVSEVTRPLARIAVPSEPPPPAPSASAPPPEEPPKPVRADQDLKRGVHMSVGDGVLYAPPDFESADGHFDVLVHYHGATELIEQSVGAAKLNALVLIINLGDGSGRYSEPLRNPRAFDEMLGEIEQGAETKLGLRTPRIRRVALSSWSAGFGAVYHVLSSRSRLDRIDALLMMDSLHASFMPGSEKDITPLSIAPFVDFAERAVAGEKLMVLTHSAVETKDYPDTTRSADGLLARVQVERVTVDPASHSPPPCDLPVAVAAFPSKERDWLRVTSEAKKGSLTVLGCSGDGKGDHIAHLAQMSATVLPPLVQRWK